jgi:hypothetical protein
MYKKETKMEMNKELWGLDPEKNYELNIMSLFDEAEDNDVNGMEVCVESEEESQDKEEPEEIDGGTSGSIEC